MTTDSHASIVPSARAAASPPPNWDHVPFDVACARCGHDIRGLTEPKCPACGLEFDWAQAVPIEQLTCERCGYHLYGLRDTRCPECGTPFTWEEALTAYHRKRIPLFEYQWRKRPVRSLISTWCRAMVPGMIWRRITIHDPPQVGALWVMVGISAIVPIICAPLMRAVVWWVSLRTQLSMGYRRQRPPPGLADLLAMVVRYSGSPDSYHGLGTSLLWCAITFASLMIFRQSMKRCKVRIVHVFRVWTYAIPMLVPIARTASFFPSFFLELMGARRPTVQNMEAVILLAWSGYAIWLLREGYRRYLRMDHSFAVAIASQLIAGLSLPLIMGWPRWLIRLLG